MDKLKKNLSPISFELDATGAIINLLIVLFYFFKSFFFSFFFLSKLCRKSRRDNELTILAVMRKNSRRVYSSRTGGNRIEKRVTVQVKRK